MTTVNLYAAKTHLSRLVEEAARGEEVVIAKAGKPMVRLVPVAREEPPRPKRRLGGLAEEAKANGWTVPDDFDTMFQDEIIAMFEGTDPESGKPTP